MPSLPPRELPDGISYCHFWSSCYINHCLASCIDECSIRVLHRACRYVYDIWWLPELFPCSLYAYMYICQSWEFYNEILNLGIDIMHAK